MPDQGGGADNERVQRMFSIILAAAALTCVWAALDLRAGGLRSHEESQR